MKTYLSVFAFLCSSATFAGTSDSIKIGDRVHLAAPGHVCITRDQANLALDMAIAENSGKKPNWYAKNLGYDLSVVCRDLLDHDGLAKVIWTSSDDPLFVKVSFKPYIDGAAYTYWAPIEFLYKERK